MIVEIFREQFSIPSLPHLDVVYINLTFVFLDYDSCAVHVQYIVYMVSPKCLSCNRTCHRFAGCLLAHHNCHLKGNSI